MVRSQTADANRIDPGQRPLWALSGTFGSVMSCIRHRRLRARIALVAIAALLWSQVVLAAHADCVMTHAPIDHVQHVASHGCHGEMPPSQQPVCGAHCSHGELSIDSGRIPPIPPMLAAAGIPLVSVAHLVGGKNSPIVETFYLHPSVSWHRPTAHPAALLLI